jgi:hypothetical protein
MGTVWPYFPETFFVGYRLRTQNLCPVVGLVFDWNLLDVVDNEDVVTT